MHRRALLAGIGTLSAGCLGASPPESGDSKRTTTKTETITRTACDGRTEATATTSAGGTETGVEYRLTDFEVSTTTDGPSVEYVLETSAFYSGDAVEREEERTGEEQVVVDISEVDDPEVRSAIETAIRTGEWRSNTVPDGLSGTVERVDFFTGVSEDDTYTHVGLTLHHLDPDAPPAVEFDATVVDDLVSPDSPGAVELELTNASDTTQQVFSGTVPPFGMVFAEAVDGSGEFLLWRDYEEEGCIRFSDGSWIRCDIGKRTELGPCESIARRYRVLPSSTGHHPAFTVPPGTGTYRIGDSLSYSEGNRAPESELSFEAEFGLESV